MRFSGSSNLSRSVSVTTVTTSLSVVSRASPREEHPPGPDGRLEKKVAWLCEAIEGMSRVP